MSGSQFGSCSGRQYLATYWIREVKDREGSRMIQVLKLVDQMDGDVINKCTEHRNRAKMSSL